MQVFCLSDSVFQTALHVALSTNRMSSHLNKQPVIALKSGALLDLLFQALEIRRTNVLSAKPLATEKKTTLNTNRVYFTYKIFIDIFIYLFYLMYTQV